MDKNVIDELSRRAAEIAADTPLADIQKNLHALFMSGLSRLELVTREEFDAQQAVLLRTREKLAAMEARVAELEARMKDERQG
ncbi:MAG: accessory factor UbiK family protein [Burkholderiales bacterium]